MKVGIPRALSYFAYYPFITTFLEKIGVEVIVSDETTKAIMDEGIADTITDACVPVKLFHGHVKNLKDRVDYVLVPRLVSVNAEATFCPKFLGLPDMLACSIPSLNNMLEIKVDLRHSRWRLLVTCLSLARKLKKGYLRAYYAFYKALSSYKNYAHQFLQGGIPPLGVLGQKKSSGVRLGVVGYPYMLYDPYLSLDMIKKLLGMGVYVVTPEMISGKEKLKHRRRQEKSLFWTFSNEVLRTSRYFLDQRSVDGIIHVTAFGCGPDFIVDKTMEIEAKGCKMPFITITLDEHTGQEGLNTRLEAFVDMLKIKRAKKEAAMA